MGVFFLSTVLNFLDRQVLAALAPTIKSEFHLTNAQYGGVLSVFGFAYALVAPFMGWLIDRSGVRWGMSVAVGVWSLAGMTTAVGRSFGELLGCRMILGAGESAGMPGLAKANSQYLKPSEYAISLAANGIAITLGSSAAPLLVAAIAPSFGWRSVFFLTGVIGVAWVPLWRFVTERAGPEDTPSNGGPTYRIMPLLFDQRLWGLTISNALIMTVYTVWTGWTTLYFVEQLHLTSLEANQNYTWLPPLFGTLGAFFGGWLVYRWIGRGEEPVTARLRSCWISAAFVLVTAAIPLAELTQYQARWATAAICLSMFWAMNLQATVHILPIDVFGTTHAAFTVSIQSFSFGLVQTFLSPLIGVTVDHFGFTSVCLVLSVLPLLGMWILAVSLKTHSAVTRDAFIAVAR